YPLRSRGDVTRTLPTTGAGLLRRGTFAAVRRRAASGGGVEVGPRGRGPALRATGLARKQSSLRRTTSARFTLVVRGPNGPAAPGRWPRPGALPRVPAHAGPSADRRPPARQARPLRRRPADAAGGPPGPRQAPRPERRPARRLAAPGAGQQPGR